MNKHLHIIYIPGLGDSRVRGQRAAVKMWPLWGVSSELIQMNWADGEAWQPKFERLLARIDAAHDTGKAVALVAVSAGATAAIEAYGARPNLQGVVLIAGKVHHPQAIGGRYRSQNPAFVEAAHGAQSSLAKLDSAQRQHILSRFAWRDEIVPRRDSVIEGARNRTVWTIGHFWTIATQIVVGAPSFLRFLKRQQQ